MPWWYEIVIIMNRIQTPVTKTPTSRKPEPFGHVKPIFRDLFSWCTWILFLKYTGWIQCCDKRDFSGIGSNIIIYFFVKNKLKHKKNWASRLIVEYFLSIILPIPGQLANACLLICNIYTLYIALYCFSFIVCAGFPDRDHLPLQPNTLSNV